MSPTILQWFLRYFAKYDSFQLFLLIFEKPLRHVDVEMVAV
jgi:hypothetical protein